MKYPTVLKYGDIDAERFDSYYARWPDELIAIPTLVVQDWIHRHWRDFRDHWIDLAPHYWQYETRIFSNEDILSIDHIGTWIQELDAEGVE